MKPNNLGGVTYEGGEIPVVIAASAQNDIDFAEHLMAIAEDRLRDQKREASGVNINPMQMPSLFGKGNLFETIDTIDKTEVKVPELPLDTTETNMTYGNLTKSLGANLLLRKQVPIARRILIETGLINTTPKARITCM